VGWRLLGKKLPQAIQVLLRFSSDRGPMLFLNGFLNSFLKYTPPSPSAQSLVTCNRSDESSPSLRNQINQSFDHA